MFRIDRSGETGGRNDIMAGHSFEAKWRAENIGGAVQVIVSRDLIY